MREENTFPTSPASESQLQQTARSEPIAYPAAPATMAIEEQRIIESTSNSRLDTGTGFGFQNWHYVTARVRLQPDGTIDQICLNTGCSFSLANTKWLRETLPLVDLHTMTTLVRVQGISKDLYDSI